MLNKKSSFKQFVTKNGFYILTGVALIAVVVTAILLPKKGEGNVAKQPEKYAQNRPATAEEIDELRVPTIDEEHSIVIEQSSVASTNENEVTEKTAEKATEKVEESKNSQLAKENKDSITKEEITSETFSSTTTTKAELFHADNDLFSWPLNEKIIYAYSDDEQGRSFMNPTLERTMRSFGIFLQATEEAKVKAAASGKVTAITNYPTPDMFPNKDYPQVGTAVIIDHGNNWKTVYGLHQGAPTVKVGDNVQVGDVIGSIGKPSRDFSLTGTNLYFQILKNDMPVNPEEKLDQALDIGVRP